MIIYRRSILNVRSINSRIKIYIAIKFFNRK